LSIRPTARFELQRRQQLLELFVNGRMVNLWKSMVKQQMRDFTITDLHDYYDFNYAIGSRVDSIIERVLAGQYRAEMPLIYREEKSLGVCRHIQIPAPSDALVFQLLTDALYESVKANQPAEGAFYARDRHNLSLPHQMDQANQYPWFILWPKFQKQIWNFTKRHKFLVTTDISNYYDNIGLRELRHVISAIVSTHEVYLDLLFSLIEDLSWNPDYLPANHKGLPTINIEAPRLLAHAFLFEVDHVLKDRTDNNFVRWMDDINFGISDIGEAKIILGELNDVLKSRGLALNLSKTEIMTTKQASSHFMFKQNLRLDGLRRKAKNLKSEGAKVKLATKVSEELEVHRKDRKIRNADKVTKRYFTILGDLGVPVALNQAVEIYSLCPQLRDSVLYFFGRLPFSPEVARAFVRLTTNTKHYDDATRFRLISAIVEWPVPRTRTGIAFVNRVKEALDNPATPFDWLCQIVFLSKYGEPNEILNSTISGRKYKEPFFARQRVAALTRVLAIKRETVLDQWQMETLKGSPDSASVASNLLLFARGSFPLKNDKCYFYLFPPSKPKKYPLSKFLILCAIASSDNIELIHSKRDAISEFVKDDWYKHWLIGICPHWF
jgi:hypothetical protein